MALAPHDPSGPLMCPLVGRHLVLLCWINAGSPLPSLLFSSCEEEKLCFKESEAESQM